MRSNPSRRPASVPDGVTRREAIQLGGGLLMGLVALPSLRPAEAASLAGRRTPLTPARRSPDNPAVPVPAESGRFRSRHTVTALPDGRVLIAGGEYAGPMSSVEILDPLSGQWWEAASLDLARSQHAAAPLADGRVLVAGGYNGQPLASAEIYDPARDRWTEAAPLPLPRYGHAATLLRGGQVLVTGGYYQGVLAGAAVYEPAEDRWVEL